MRYYPTV